MTDIGKLPTSDLLPLYANIINELRSRGITRSANLVGGLAEYLFCKAFNLEQAGNSKANFDAVDSEGNKYQIKARWLTAITHPASCRPFGISAGSTSTCWLAFCLKRTSVFCERHSFPVRLLPTAQDSSD